LSKKGQGHRHDKIDSTHMCPFLLSSRVDLPF
jgi:hypothetical protein